MPSLPLSQSANCPPGYTQSGPLFRAKTRALEKQLHKFLGQNGLSATFIFPTAPIRLRPADIPGYEPPEGDSADKDEEKEPPESFGWYRKDAATGAYRDFHVGMAAVAVAVRDCGGVDGMIGFSQGGAVAAIAAAALEDSPARTAPATTAEETAEEDRDGASFAWVEELREANGRRPLRFCVVYSGFFAPGSEFGWCYADGGIRTPNLHYIGGLDSVVEEARSTGLVDRCDNPEVVRHPGGHYVPISREWTIPLVLFLIKTLKEEDKSAVQTPQSSDSNL